jgi:hypothetical protein
VDPAGAKAFAGFRRRLQRYDLLQTWKGRLRRWAGLGG